MAVIDSGVHGVDDLKDALGHNRIVFNYDSLGGGADDQYGHGTHVAGIIGGSGKDSICSNCDVTIRGIAPNVNIINFHALGQTGQGTDSSVINAINKAISLKSQYNIRVMNLSLGRSVYESYTLDPLCQAVEAAWKAGIVCIFRLIDHTHAAAAELLYHAVVRDGRSDHWAEILGRAGGQVNEAGELGVLSSGE